MIPIGFGFEKYVGKDTCANLLITHLRTIKKGILVTKTGFASKLKATCYDLYSWAGLMDEEYYEQHPELKDVVLPAIGKSPRKIWIEFGTTVCRSIYPDTWLVYPFEKYKTSTFLLFKDLRFPNEANAILQRGGIIFKVTNPRIARTSDVADDALINYGGWTAEIINDGDFATLNKRVLQVVMPHIK